MDSNLTLYDNQMLWIQKHPFHRRERFHRSTLKHFKVFSSPETRQVEGFKLDVLKALNNFEV